MLSFVLLGADIAMAADPVVQTPVAAPAQTQATPTQAQPVPAPTPTPKSQTAAALENLSKSISGIHFGVKQLLDEINQVQDALEGISDELKNPHDRRVWLFGFVKCWLVIVLGYLSFFFSHRLTDKVVRRLTRPVEKSLVVKLIHALLVWLLNLMPLAIFAIVSYLALIFLHVDPQLQWALLAWVSAFLIANTLMTIFDLVLTVFCAFPKIFLLTHDSAQFFKRWLRFLTDLVVYGYFILQVMLFLGASQDVYSILLKLLGLLVTLSLIVFVMQTPLRIIKFFKIHPEKWAHIQTLCRAVAVIYLALLYLVWIARADHFFWFVLRGTVFSLIVIILAFRLTRVVYRYLSREVKISPHLRKRLPGLEQRARRYRRSLGVIVQAFVYTVMVLLLFKIWRGPEAAWLPSGVKEMLVVKTVAIICIFLVAVLIWELSNSIMEISLTKNGEDLTIESGRTHTLLTMARKTIFVALALVVLLMVLAEMGVNIAPLLAGAGVLGLAVGIGAQKLMQDLITGFFMLLENQIAVGDWVKIGDYSGTVEAISIRILRLRDTAGVVNMIPYSSITTVSNYTKEFSYSLLDVSVAYRENVEQVIEVLRQIAEELRQDPIFSLWILEPLEVMGLDKFAESAMVVRVRLKTKPGMQWQVSREFNRRMKQKFDELDIQIPFPHTTIFFGENKDGTAPAVHLQMEKITRR